jgi:hypothetical protein
MPCTPDSCFDHLVPQRRCSSRRGLVRVGLCRLRWQCLQVGMRQWGLRVLLQRCAHLHVLHAARRDVFVVLSGLAGAVSKVAPNAR